MKGLCSMIMLNVGLALALLSALTGFGNPILPMLYGGVGLAVAPFIYLSIKELK